MYFAPWKRSFLSTTRCTPSVFLLHSVLLSLSPHLLHSRHYEYSSSGESSPELPVLSKHPPHHPPPSSHPSPPSGGPPPPTRDRGGDSEPGTPPYYSGYNSAEEYEATHAPFFDLEVTHTHTHTLCTPAKRRTHFVQIMALWVSSDDLLDSTSLLWEISTGPGFFRGVWETK